MPRRNFEKAVDRLISQFYPGMEPDSAGMPERRTRAADFIREMTASNPDGISTRRIHAEYNRRFSGSDPLMKVRPKLGENKKLWGYYVLRTETREITDGPFQDRDEIGEIPAGFQIITATEAKRRGYLSRFEAEKAVAA